jgi:hypothetical protein
VTQNPEGASAAVRSSYYSYCGRSHG